jgi:hypothetical protein
MSNPNSDLPNCPRRRFQFRLRTLLIGVTLFCVFGGYVGWQAKILKQRKMLASELSQHGGAIVWSSEESKMHPGSQFIASEKVTYRWPYPQASWLRRLLGDDYALAILHSRISDEVLDQIRAAFPEAEFVKMNY